MLVSVRWLSIAAMLGVWSVALVAAGQPTHGAVAPSEDGSVSADEAGAPTGGSQSGPPAEERVAAIARAREAYAEGEQAYAVGDYGRALAAFQLAYASAPNPVVLRSMAKSEERLGQVSAAIEHLSEYLRVAPAADPSRPQVEQELAELRQRPGMLVFKLKPADAQVRIDGNLQQSVPRIGLPVAPGPHEVTVERTGHEAATETIEVQAGRRQFLDVTLVPVLEEPSAPVVAVADETQSSDHTALWVAGGVGVAGLVAGGVLGYMALEESHKFDDRPTADRADRGERYALFSDVAFGVAALAAVTVGVLYFTATDEEAPEQVQVGLTPLQGGGMAAARFRY